MFEENDIFIFNRDNFNYLRRKVREIDAEGYEQEYGSNYGLIVAATRPLRHNTYNISSKTVGKTYQVSKNGDIINLFKTFAEAKEYTRKMQDEDFVYNQVKYSFEDMEDMKDLDYLHIGTNMDASMAVLIDAHGRISTRSF